ncbi:MAG: hypothetical protein RR554_04370, partial [Vagococcus sp.]|uniref:hypothetical protein n=1 Tax=Vagococcus sp. TaxID=1933889 RepID=UPI002FCA5329
DIKKKKMLGLLSICLIIVTFNYFLSTVSFSVKKDSLKVTKTVIIRDKDYNGENSNRDWNTVLMTNVKSKNPFLKVDADSFIAKANKNRINGNVQMTFILFNIFDVNKETQVNQTVMLDNFIPNSKIQMSLEGTKEKITTTVY